MVEATLAAEQFALYETLTQYPTAEFDILRLVANGTGRAMPFVWAAGDDLEGLPAAMNDDPSTEDVEVVTEFDDEYLLRMEWMAHTRVIHYILIEEDATIIDATGKNGTWQFRILFPEHDSVSTTYDFCDEYGIELEFNRIYQLSDSFRRGQYGLSESQYETIVRAHQEGYYDVPRAVNLQELANRLDVSHQALSERVRRGHETLIANTLRPELEAPVQQF
jgi:predicted DNA binding protein